MLLSGESWERPFSYGGALPMRLSGPPAALQHIRNARRPVSFRYGIRGDVPFWSHIGPMPHESGIFAVEQRRDALYYSHIKRKECADRNDLRGCTRWPIRCPASPELRVMHFMPALPRWPCRQRPTRRTMRPPASPSTEKTWRRSRSWNALLAAITSSSSPRPSASRRCRKRPFRSA